MPALACAVRSRTKCLQQLHNTTTARCSRENSILRRPRLRTVLHSRGVHAKATSGFATSQDLAVKLVQHFYELRSYTKPFSQAILDFTDGAILAYECGYNEETIKQELELCLSCEELDAKLKAVDQDQLMQWLGLVWLTLMMSPRTLNRWSSGTAVGADTEKLWRGFVALIVVAYFEKRMAWYYLDRLQMELQLAGRMETERTVAEHARIVFATLETVYPQFPSK